MAKCVSPNEYSTEIVFDKIKLTTQQTNNNQDGPDISELSKNDVTYFSTANSNPGNRIHGKRIYTYNSEYPYSPPTYSVDELPVALSRPANPYAGLCNTYTNNYTASENNQLKLFEKMVLILETCSTHSHTERSLLPDNVEQNKQINILSRLYNSINREISNRGMSMSLYGIGGEWLKGQEIRTSDLNGLVSKLRTILNEKSSPYHYDLTTDSLITSVPTINNFKETGTILTSAYGTLSSTTEVVLNDCICYADCNSYYVCYCYGNCNYY